MCVSDVEFLHNLKSNVYFLFPNPLHVLKLVSIMFQMLKDQLFNLTSFMFLMPISVFQQFNLCCYLKRSLLYVISLVQLVMSRLSNLWLTNFIQISIQTWWAEAKEVVPKCFNALPSIWTSFLRCVTYRYVDFTVRSWKGQKYNLFFVLC